MREMKDSGVEWLGDIPKTWDIVQLGSLFSEHKHKNIGMQSNNLLSLSYGNIIRKDINTSDGLLPESFEGYNVIDDGDIVLRLTDLQNDQRSLRVGLSHESGIVTSAYVTLRQRNTAIDSKFYYYLLHSYDIRKGFYGMGAGVRQGLTYAGIRKIMLTLPTADEQHRIVGFLEKKMTGIDTLMGNVQTQIEKLKFYKQSLITEVVTKGLDQNVPMKDSGVEWIGEIAETHTVYRLKYLLRTPMQYGANESGDKFKENAVRYIRITDITVDGNLKDDESNQYLPLSVAAGYILKDKDVLFARSGGTVGKSFLYHEYYGASAFAGYLIKAECDEESLLPEYLIYYTQSSLYELWKSMIFIQATIQNIGANKYSNMEIPIPSIESQTAIVEYLADTCSKIDRLIAVKQSKIEKLEQYKSSLIYEYVTGKKEVL